VQGRSGLCHSFEANFWMEIKSILNQRNFLRISVTIIDQLNTVYYRVYLMGGGVDGETTTHAGKC